jgi:hypothetical protein
VERINRELEQAYIKLLDNASKLDELSIEKERIYCYCPILKVSLKAMKK